MKSFFATKRTSSRGPHLWMWSGKHRATHRFALGMVAAWLFVWLMFTLQRGPVGAPSLAQQQPNQPLRQGHQGTEVKKQGHSQKGDELSVEQEISPSPNSPLTQTDINQQSFLQHTEQGSIELEQRLRDLKDIIEKRRAKVAGRQEQELGTVVDRSAPDRVLKRNKAETAAEETKETFIEWFKRESGKELTEFNSYPTSQELTERAQLKLKDKHYGRENQEEESYYVENSREETQDHEKNNAEHEQQKAEDEGADFEGSGNESKKRASESREERDESETGQANAPLGLATPEEEEYEVLFPKPSLPVAAQVNLSF